MKEESFGIVPILQRQGKDHFLVVQHQAGHWGFPKGHAEAGETEVETACREFEEETGIHNYQLINPTPFQEVYTLTKKGQTITKTVTYFLALVQSEQVQCQAKEIRDYDWLPLEAALERITYSQSKQLLLQVEQYLQQKHGS